MNLKQEYLNCSERSVQFQVRETSLVDLNDYCLLLIFKHLPIRDRLRLRAACKRFRDVAEALTWTDITKLDEEQVLGFDLKTKADSMHISVMRKLIPLLGKHLTELDLYHTRVPERKLTKIGFWCPKVQKIKFGSKSPFTEIMISSIAIYCDDLTSLTFHCKHPGISDRRLKILGNCTKLTHFSMTDNPMTCGKFLMNLPKTLLSIKIKHCARLSATMLNQVVGRFDNLNTIVLIDSLSRFDRAYSKSTVKLLPYNIKHLEMPFFRPLSLNTASLWTGLVNLNLAGSDIDDKLLRVISKGCLELSNLKLSFCQNITNAGVRALGCARNLKTLNLAHVPNITDAVFKYLPRGIEKLICPYNDDIKNGGVVDFLMTHSEVNLLNVSYCFGISKDLVDEAKRNVTTHRVLHFPNPVSLTVVMVGL